MSDQNKPWRAALDRVAKLLEAEKFEAAERTLLKLIPQLENSDDPEQKIALGEALYQFARLYNIHGDEDDPYPLVHKAMELLESSDAHQSEMIELLQMQATSEWYFHNYNFEGAESCHLRAKKLAEQHFGTDSPQYTSAVTELARLYVLSSMFQEDNQLLEKAGSLFSEITSQALESEYFDVYIGFCDAYKSFLLNSEGFECVVEFLEQQWDKVQTGDIDTEDEFNFVTDMISFFFAANKYEKALDIYQTVLKRHEEQGLKQFLPRLHREGANIYAFLNRDKEAEEIYRKAFETFDEKIHDPMDLRLLEWAYAEFLWIRNRFDEALEIVKPVVENLADDDPIILPNQIDACVWFIKSLRAGNGDEDARELAGFLKQIEIPDEYYSDEQKLQIQSQLDF